MPSSHCSERGVPSRAVTGVGPKRDYNGSRAKPKQLWSFLHQARRASTGDLPRPAKFLGGRNDAISGRPCHGWYCVNGQRAIGLLMLPQECTQQKDEVVASTINRPQVARGRKRMTRPGPGRHEKWWVGKFGCAERKQMKEGMPAKKTRGWGFRFEPFAAIDGPLFSFQVEVSKSPGCNQIKVLPLVCPFLHRVFGSFEGHCFPQFVDSLSNPNFAVLL